MSSAVIACLYTYVYGSQFNNQLEGYVDQAVGEVGAVFKMFIRRDHPVSIQLHVTQALPANK